MRASLDLQIVEKFLELEVGVRGLLFETFIRAMNCAEALRAVLRLAISAGKVFQHRLTVAIDTVWTHDEVLMLLIILD